jgi:hypothetical protein
MVDKMCLGKKIWRHNVRGAKHPWGQNIYREKTFVWVIFLRYMLEYLLKKSHFLSRVPPDFFFPPGVLSPRMLGLPDILSRQTLCPLGHPSGHLVPECYMSGCYVAGRFASGRFVAPDVIVPSSKSRNIPEVVIIRRGAGGVLGIWEGWVNWVKGGANGVSLQAT